MATCSESLFSDVQSALDSTWSELWPFFVANEAPKKAGGPFGSCYTVCGSVGFTDISGLEQLEPNMGDARATFTTCGLKDLAVLVVPLGPASCTISTEIRATGQGQLWPSGLLGAYQHPMTASVTGFLVLTVPVDHSSDASTSVVKWTEVSLDLSVQAVWTTAWPNDDSPLFPSVPQTNALSEWTTAVANKASAKMLDQLRRKVQRANAPAACAFPTVLEQVCSAETAWPAGPCHPCDTCCKCMIQQICGGACADCPCVNCGSTKWSWTLTVPFVMMSIVIVAIVGRIIKFEL